LTVAGRQAKDKEATMADRVIPGESWEEFDAEGLFPPPRLHANHLTKVDKKEMTKVDAPEDQGEMSGSSNPEDIGDTYSDAPVDKNHVDEMFEMEGLNGSSDERELKADKEIDKRTEEPEQSDSEDADDPSKGDDQKPHKNSDQSSESGDEPAAREDQQETAKEPSASEEEKPEPTDEEGTNDPIQKESEGIEDVAEATSKTSEDVHGGDEATKDIEDSPNAADDGQNPDNEGVESGEGVDEGEGDDGSGGASEAETDADSDGGERGEGFPDGDADGSDAEGETSGDPLATEDWEVRADHSATALKLIDDLKEVEAKARDENGHRTTLPQYNFNREASPAELEIAFKKASELLKKFAAEEEITARRDGTARWDAEKLVRALVTYRHQRIPSSKYEHPKEADICILLDISGSCAQQAEMFMAIAAGSIGSGVRVFVGYNGSCRACAMDQPKRRIRSYTQAKPWVQSEVARVAGWNNATTIGEWNFEQFLDEAEPKTVIIFGDWDGVDQYTASVKNPKFGNIRFFWFANEGYGSWRSANAENRIPDGFTTKNYVPGIFTPRDFVKALRKLK
jgi:hypothetical protein